MYRKIYSHANSIRVMMMMMMMMTPGNSYFAQLPPVFGHFMFLSGGLLDCSNGSTLATITINSNISTR